MPENLKIEQTGPSIGTLFANTVSDVRKGIMPLRSSAAIDLKVSFASVEVNRNGWSLIYVKQSENSSTLKMELATRIHTDGLAAPSMEDLIRFVQAKLVISENFAGTVDGKRTDEFDSAVRKEIADRRVTADPLLKGKMDSWDTSKALFVGLLQILLELPSLSCDGIYGPQTEFAFISRGTDYSLSKF